MTSISVVAVRTELADTLNRVAYGGERVTLVRRGKGVAVLVSMEDAELLEAIEDREDIKAIKRARAEMKRKGQKPVAWADAKAKLGL